MSGGSGMRLAWVDTGRGLAIALVVLFHATNWLIDAGFPSQWWSETNQVLATMRLPLFFLLSGLFAVKWMTAPWRSLWATKLSLFVWVFGLWSVIATFTFMAGLHMQGREGNYLSQLRGLLSMAWDPRFELWFIWALAIFFVAAKFIHKVPPFVQLGVAGILSVIALSGYVESTVGVQGALKYFFFFLIGLHLRSMIFRWSDGAHWSLRLATVAVAAGIAVGGTLRGWNTTIPGYYFVACVLGALSGVVISGWLSRVGVLSRIGRQTLPIYLTHTSVIILACWCLAFLPDEAKNLALGLSIPPALAVASIAVSLVVAHAVRKRPLLRYAYEQPGWFAAPPRRSRLSDAA